MPYFHLWMKDVSFPVNGYLHLELGGRMSSKKKHRNGSCKNKKKCSYQVPLGLHVFGLEGCISHALSSAFRERVINQVARKMHLAFADAQFGVVGGKGQHLVVRISMRNGWMITDPQWVENPPHEILDAAVESMMCRYSDMRKSEARGLIVQGIQDSYEACKELRRRIQKRRNQLKKGIRI
jgi:hypothetical protein